jgi:hypothetical protein
MKRIVPLQILVVCLSYYAIHVWSDNKLLAVLGAIAMAGLCLRFCHKRRERKIPANHGNDRSTNKR